MRIVECIQCLINREGAEVLFCDLVSYLSHKNCELYVVVLYNKIHPSFQKILNVIPEDHIFVLNKKAKIDFKVAREFKKIINKINPDIINTHLSCLPTYYLAFGKKKRNWNIVHTLHNVANKENTKIGIMVQKLFSKCSFFTFVGISKLITESAVDLYKKSKIYTIYNGVKFRESTNNLQKEFDFICVARFSNVKNHLFLLEIFNEILKSMPSTKLVLVGDGENKDKIKAFIIKNNLENNVILTGVVDDVYSWLNRSKIFVLPSLYEGNPISILEALHCGLPIIASSVGGIPDVVKDENGILINPNNGEQLLCAMDSCLRDNKWLSYSAVNTDRANAFSIEKCGENYYNLFVKLSCQK